MSTYGRFYQIGYVARDIDAAINHLQQRMGATLVDVIHDIRTEAGDQVCIKNLSHLALPGVELEVIQPRLDHESIYLEALPKEDDKVSFHHLGFLIPDQQAWEQAIASFDTFDTPIVMEGGTSEVRFAYFDTRRQCGHYSEIAWRYDPENARVIP